jgi:predicted Zn-ribbon and HTH transcriptional regulator
MENKKQPIELADIFRRCGDDFPKTYNLCADQAKAFYAIENCRTSALGGHTNRCNHCGFTKQSYNSCRNRHCPKCQYTKKLQWVDKLAANLPPVKYFHVVFTIPDCLNTIFYINQRMAYGLLFKAAGQALIKCAANPKLTGVRAGAVGVLHTWGQTLVYHPHIHMIVPAGGLSEDQMEWIPSPKKFFLPVKLLSNVFRGILCSLICQAVGDGKMQLPDNTEDFETIKALCYRKNWVVYCQKPFAGPEGIIQYLGNYTHRVAISNHRIEAFENNNVTFSYKDYRTGGLKKSITLETKEFVRRFMQHILPCGFYKIRYFGILALCNMATKLETCFSLIEKESYFSVLEGLNAMEVWRAVSGKDPWKCPKCHQGKMIAYPLETRALKTG